LLVLKYTRFLQQILNTVIKTVGLSWCCRIVRSTRSRPNKVGSNVRPSE